MKKPQKLRNEISEKGRKKKVPRMLKWIGTCVAAVLTLYAVIQGIRCIIAVKDSEMRLAAYGAKTMALSYGDMTYVDQGKGQVILSMHGMFGGYDQGFDTCKDFSRDYRIIAPSRFGYLKSSISGDGTPSEQAAAYVELLDKLKIDKVYPLATSAGGTAAIRFALDYPERTKGLILFLYAAFQKNGEPAAVYRPAGIFMQ